MATAQLQRAHVYTPTSNERRRVVSSTHQGYTCMQSRMLAPSVYAPCTSNARAGCLLPATCLRNDASAWHMCMQHMFCVRACILCVSDMHAHEGCVVGRLVHACMRCIPAPCDVCAPTYVIDAPSVHQTGIDCVRRTSTARLQRDMHTSLTRRSIAYDARQRCNCSMYT